MRIPVEDTASAKDEAEDTPQSADSYEDVLSDAYAGKDMAAGLSPDETEYFDEEALIEAAKRAGDAAAEAELAADAKKIAEERDSLQKKLADSEDALESAKKTAAEAKERLLRVQADWENYRKRTAQERLNEKQLATEKLVVNLLPVIDDLERALEHADAGQTDEHLSSFVGGIEAVHAKLLQVLAKEGVEVIDPKGEAFDPLEQQAVGRSENKDVFDETVDQVYQKGYRMGGRVIRSAMVTVFFGGAKRPEDDTKAKEPPKV